MPAFPDARHTASAMNDAPCSSVTSTIRTPGVSARASYSSMLWVPGMPNANGMPSSARARATMRPPVRATMSGRGEERAGLAPDAFGHAIGQRHDGEVGIDLQRVGEERRVGDEQPGHAVHPAPRVGDPSRQRRVPCRSRPSGGPRRPRSSRAGSARRRSAHRCAPRRRARSAADRRRRMHPQRPPRRRRSAPTRASRAPSPRRCWREGVAHHRPAGRVHGDAVARRRRRRTPAPGSSGAAGRPASARCATARSR